MTFKKLYCGKFKISKSEKREIIYLNVHCAWFFKSELKRIQDFNCSVEVKMKIKTVVAFQKAEKIRKKCFIKFAFCESMLKLNLIDLFSVQLKNPELFCMNV